MKPADSSPVGHLATLLRVVAVSASLMIALGFLLFAGDETDKGSRGQVSKLDNAINAPDPTQQQELLRQRQHGELREGIDDANDFLLKPFAPVVENSESTWARRGVPTLLALLLYGLGGLLLANFLPKPDTKQRDWRGVPT
jgi:hypothetical protein